MKRVARILMPLLVVGAGVVVWQSTTRDDSARLHASGTVEATVADLGFQIPGRVERVPVREGDRVRAGDVLAELDLDELEARIAGAEAQREAAGALLDELVRGARPEELSQAQAAARAAERRLDNARSEQARAARLFDGGAISRQALEAATTTFDVAEAAADQAREAVALLLEGSRDERIRAQRAAVAQADATVAQMRAAAAHGVVRAPFDGRVTVRHREPGESVMPGAPVITLLNPDDRWVRIYIREDRIGAVQIGQRASISSDTYPDRRYVGEVVFIGDEAEFTPRNVQTTEERVRLVYPVKVRIVEDGAFDLKPGIPADVELESSS